ncbi:MAG: hypothetical protein PHN72_02885 [Bacilli bacterium]|nr:hypothetical protein [Bacilli bacterium]
MNREEKSKIKGELRNLKIQNRREKKEKADIKWIITIFITAFVISFGLSFVSETTLPKAPFYIGIVLVFFFIFIGVLFDMIGVAVTASEEKVFHSMNARKVKGANIAVKWKKNADKVSSFCNDVIGDICGVISGSAGVTIALSLSQILKINSLFITLFVTAIIASLTIGGKAIGKSIAINKANLILYRFSKMVSYIYKVK